MAAPAAEHATTHGCCQSSLQHLMQPALHMPDCTSKHRPHVRSRHRLAWTDACHAWPHARLTPGIVTQGCARRRLCLDTMRVDSAGGEVKAAVCYAAYGYMGAQPCYLHGGVWPRSADL